ncbi:MAG: N-acetylmuramoyl-L-alanine amidase family protein [Lachnospiraceae bacterium]|nr:N-acetylmuramoyl-L-alanine amidase family protein [Lachnospiraceae bacterium]
MENRFDKGRIQKSMCMLAAAVLLVVLSVQTAFAATSYVNSVNITVDVDLELGERLPSLTVGYTGDSAEVMIPSNDKYDIQSAKWSDSGKDVELGGTYTMKVTLDAINNYKFSSGTYNSSKVKIKGGTLVSAKRQSSGTLLVTIKTKEAKGDLDAPEEAWWDGTRAGSSKFGYAKWESVGSAAYDVALYRGSKLVEKVTDLHTTTYNFYPYMTTKGTYTFRVRSIPVNENVSKYAKRSEWQISDELYVEEDEVSDGKGKPSTGSTAQPDAPDTQQVGWIENGGHHFFRWPDGSYVKNDWANIGNVWYLFDASGAMLTGWQQKDGLYYYLNAEGRMLTGWYKENETWYYLTDSGSMAVGWLPVGDKTYYLNESGAMVTGWYDVNGETYYFYPDGHKAANEWVDGLFYVDQDGIWKR